MLENSAGVNDPSLGGRHALSGSEPSLNSATQQALLRALKQLRSLTLDDAAHGAAIWEVAQVGRPATPALLLVLQDEHPAVRQRAAAALGRIADPLALDGLVTAMADAHHAVRRSAAWALGVLRDERAVPALLAGLADAHLEVRQRCAWALGEVGDPQAVAGLLEALHDENHFVRIAASKALGELRDRRAVPALLQALDNVDPGVRQIAAAALGSIGDPAAVPRLIALLEDHHELYDPVREQGRVCDQAARALARINSPQAQQALAAWQRRKM